MKLAEKDHFFAHRLEMIEILLKGCKIANHLSICLFRILENLVGYQF